MLNLKKAAFNITSKFGLLQAHRSLVLTISEERQVYDTILKLILARVNASTSLLKWAKKESNESLKENIKLLYDINMIWTTVQKEYAEQTNEFSTSLKEILQIEIGIDAIKKELKNTIEKKEKIQKQLSDNTKRKTDQNLENDLAKVIEEEETLQSELEVKTLKAEIFKGKTLKTSLLNSAKSHIQLADRMKEIFTTAEKIINTIPDVVTPVREEKTAMLSLQEKQKIVSDLSSTLKIQKPISDMIFHVDLPTSPSKTLVTKSPTTYSDNKTKIPGMRNHKLSRSDMDNSPKPDWEYNDFVFVSNVPPPKTMPPPVPEYRPRAKTNIHPNHKKGAGLVRKNQIRKKKFSTPDFMHYASVDDSEDYVEPNLTNTLTPSHRSSSDSELSKSDYGYCPPWENLMPNWNSSDNLLDEKQTRHSSLPHCYDEPFGDKTKLGPSQSTFVYDEPYQIGQDSFYHRFLDNEESSSDISDDSSEISEDSHSDRNNNNISPNELASKQPVPVPRQRKQSTPILSSETDTSNKKPQRPSLPVFLPLKREKATPQPKPRPRTIVDNDDDLKQNSMFFVDSEKNPNAENQHSPPRNSPPKFSPLSPVDAKNMKNIVLELKGKLQPIGGSVKTS